MKHIETHNAPAAVGPYSQAIITDNLVYVSGQIALIPGEGKQLDNADIATETHRVLKNLGAILKAAGCSYANVIQARIYITDPGLFAEVNAVYGQYFNSGSEPARECVVAAPPLPGAHVEISMVAELPSK